MNTDGVKVFKSKGQSSLRPIQMFLNELPCEKRFKRENVILTGIWFGKSLDMSLYLKPFTDEMKDLEENKIQVNENGNTYDVIIRAFIISTDTMAKPKLMAMKQFNGKYCCPYCLHPGNTKGDPKDRKYHLSVNGYASRTHASTVEFMQQFLTTEKLLSE